jgi:hypothetical protein
MLSNVSTPRLSELRAMRDEVVAEQFDAAAPRAGGGISFWREEVARREVERQTRTIVRLTWAIAAMTLAILLATIVNVVLFALSP